MKIPEFYKVKKATAYLKHYGVAGLSAKALTKVMDNDDYSDNYQALLPMEDELVSQRMKKFDYMPLISILVPVFNPDKIHFSDMILSVLHQTYANWELVLVDASDEKLESVVNDIVGDDERVRYVPIANGQISANTNAALSIAKGEYITLLDNDDTLSEEALYCMVEEINKGADCVYSDEDKMDSDGVKHFCPHIKPDYDPILLRTNNYICHLFMVKTEIAREVGGFSSEYDGAQDFDFILKCTHKAHKVAHVNNILYHWREHAGSTAGNPLSKMYAYEAGRKAIESFLEREGRTGEVTMLADMGYYRVDYALPEALPKVKIVVLGVRDKDYAKEYFSYIKKTTDYTNISLCAMWDADVERINSFDCDLCAVIMAGTMIEDADWLGKLVSDMTAEQVQVVAAKTTLNEPYFGIKSINKSFLAFAGREYVDAFGDVYENAGKPAWYKGHFNRTLLASGIEKTPRTGILIDRATYVKMLSQGWQLPDGARAMYEPDVVLARF